jgi:hypothetical protein
MPTAHRSASIFGTVAVLLSGTVANAMQLPATRNLEVACENFTIRVSSGDKTGHIYRLDITDEKADDSNALTVKYGRGGTTWGRWFKDGDVIDFPERWNGKKLSWMVKSEGESGIIYTLRIGGKKGTFSSEVVGAEGNTIPCRVVKNEFWAPRDGTP